MGKLIFFNIIDIRFLICCEFGFVPIFKKVGRNFLLLLFCFSTYTHMFTFLQVCVASASFYASVLSQVWCIQAAAAAL